MPANDSCSRDSSQRFNNASADVQDSAQLPLLSDQPRLAADHTCPLPNVQLMLYWSTPSEVEQCCETATVADVTVAAVDAHTAQLVCVAETPKHCRPCICELKSRLLLVPVAVMQSGWKLHAYDAGVVMTQSHWV